MQQILIQKVYSEPEIQKCFGIRLKVFVEGQNVPHEEEIDGKDDQCQHYLVSIEGKPVGTARIQYLDDIAKIERVAILPEHQGMSLGKMLMNQIISDLKESNDFTKAKLGSQTHAIPFYEKLGFKICSEEYLDAGINHKDMELDL